MLYDKFISIHCRRPFITFDIVALFCGTAHYVVGQDTSKRPALLMGVLDSNDYFSSALKTAVSSCAATEGSWRRMMLAKSELL